MAANGSLAQTTRECSKLQHKSAKQLEEIANMLRRQQKDMNIAKVSFASAGVVAGGLTVAGLILAPFTGGLSIGLMVAGAGVGVAAGAGEVSTSVAEFKVLGKRVEEAQKILDELGDKTLALLEKLRPELELRGVSWENFLTNLGKEGAVVGKGVVTLAGNIKTAISVASATSKAERIIAVFAGQELPKTVSRVVARAGLNPTVLSKVLQPIAAGATGFSIGVGIADIIDKSIKIHKNVSEVADKIDEMAACLRHC